MRTPGADFQLALGFLFAEDVIAGLADVGSIYHCGRTDAPFGPLIAARIVGRRYSSTRND